MKRRIWTSDGFAGLVYDAVFLLVAHVIFPASFPRQDHTAYDPGADLARALPGNQIAVTAIRESGINTLGPAIDTLILLPQIRQYLINLRGKDFDLALRVDGIRIMH